MFDSLDRTAEAILVALAEGRALTPLVRQLKRSRTALHYDKVKLGRLIQACLGQDILAQVRASIVAKKRGNARGAKGCRKVEAQGL